MCRIFLHPLVWAAVGLLPGCTASFATSVTTWHSPKDDMTFVWVPAGGFTAKVLAERTSVGDPEKVVPREVTFPQGFWLGRTEVTVGQFRRFVNETGYITDAEKATSRFTWKSPGFSQQANHPVVCLSYNDARRYAAWAGADLPTDAEWLYACRAGTTTKFYWGDAVDDRYVWHRCNTQGLGTRPVAGKRPNSWGLYDMVGNAWEYCKAGDQSECFSLRGGSWTRCPQYRTRQGVLKEDVLAEAVEPRLQEGAAPPEVLTCPWDDDRGFRCIRRTGPDAK